MLTEDYFMRMINQALYVLKKILGLKTTGHYGEALREIDQLLEVLVGLKGDLVHRLDDQSILDSLTQQDTLDADRLYVIADLFKEEGDIRLAMGQVEEGYWSYLRSLNFFIETALRGKLDYFERPHDRIKLLLEKLQDVRLPADSLYPLYCYYEETGQFQRAEDALLKLTQEPDLEAEMRAEMGAFYQRLLEKEDEALRQGGLSRSEVEKRLEGDDRSNT
jgi:hypothetical protein